MALLTTCPTCRSIDVSRSMIRFYEIPLTMCCDTFALSALPKAFLALAFCRSYKALIRVMNGRSVFMCVRSKGGICIYCITWLHFVVCSRRLQARNRSHSGRKRLR